MDNLLVGYIEDLKDYVMTFNEALIELETGPADKEVVNTIFRVAHTIKGNSAAMQFMKIKEVMHTMEDILHEVREGQRQMTHDLVLILFACHDFLEDCITVIASERSDEKLQTGSLTAMLQAVKANESISTTKATQGRKEEGIASAETKREKTEEGIKTMSGPGTKECCGSANGDEGTGNQGAAAAVDFPYDLSKELTDIITENMQRGMNLYDVAVRIRSDCMMKTVRNVILGSAMEAHGYVMGAYPPRPAQEALLNPDMHFDQEETRYLMLSEEEGADMQAALGEESEVERVRVTAVVLEDFKAMIAIPYEDRMGIGTAGKRVGDLLVEAGAISPTDVAQVLELQKNAYADMKFGEVALKEQMVTPEELTQALHVQITEKEAAKGAEATEFVRVSSQKVDQLVEMLGELLIFNSQLEQYALEELSTTSKTMNILPRMAKIIKNVQDLSMSLRMVAVKPVLHKLTRIARDTSAELGKKVSVVIEGENTEIDKSASEKIFDPLMHIVRNAVAHGIEDEESRISSGKRPEGQVRIQAYNRRGQVCIEVSDDGGGIDTQKLYRKALEKKMIDPNRSYTEDEIMHFIFLPGFSTQEQINEISGRGVGMNVVESEITKLHGKVEIRSELGRGTVFALRIPMNMAVLNGTTVLLQDNRFIIPTLFIKEFYIVRQPDWVSMQGIKRAVRVRENIIPILTADLIFQEDTGQNLDDLREIVIMELDQRQIALPVDRILGRQEVVAKPLNEEFAGIDIFSGASILGDGRVTMILDVEALYRLV